MSKFELKKDLTGRLLAINQMKCKKFSCGGFSVNMYNPSAVVMMNAQQDQIRMALLDGRLVDITDQNEDGLIMGGARHTKPVLEDTGEKVFITVATNGAMSVAIPSDQKEQEAFERQISDVGVLILDKPKISCFQSPLVAGMVGNNKETIIENFTQKVNTLKRSN